MSFTCLVFSKNTRVSIGSANKAINHILNYKSKAGTCHQLRFDTRVSIGFANKAINHILNYKPNAGTCHRLHFVGWGAGIQQTLLLLYQKGAGIVQRLQRRTRDWKVAGSNPCRSGGRIFFSMINFLRWLLLRVPVHPRVTAAARKRSRSFCQKCRWQVTAKHAYT